MSTGLIHVIRATRSHSFNRKTDPQGQTQAFGDGLNRRLRVRPSDHSSVSLMNTDLYDASRYRVPHPGHAMMLKPETVVMVRPGPRCLRFPGQRREAGFENVHAGAKFSA